MSIKTACVLAATLGLVGAFSTQAQPSDYSGSGPVDEVVVSPPYLPPGAELKSKAVYFDDLDLSTNSGAYTLMQRINGAARQVCSPEPETRSGFGDHQDYENCMAGAVGRAVTDVDAPTLSELYSYGSPRYARAYDYRRGGY